MIAAIGVTAVILDPAASESLRRAAEAQAAAARAQAAREAAARASQNNG